MKKILCAVLVMVMAFAGASFAHDGYEEKYVREEANIKLDD